MTVPELPGQLLEPSSPEATWLKERVAQLCELDNPNKFPGSQPVSFCVNDLDKLEKQDYWVCEKSDGIRVLFLIVTDPEGQTIFIIDRHNDYRQQAGFYFPHFGDNHKPLGNTLIDGELVLDLDKSTGKQQMRLLAFDCLVIDDQNVMKRPLDKRYGRLDAFFYRPYKQMLTDHPNMANNQPFEICVKAIEFSYYIDKIFNVDMPLLQHDSDGLIYTCVSTPYSPGTDNNILKWKPPSENSIDFKLVLRFPPSPDNPREPDWHAKPLFLLHVWCGNSGGMPRYKQYDDMYVTDDEWDDLKRSGEQIDDRIVEVHWDPELTRWRMMRFRDDKPHGNHKSIVEEIIQSIEDGVEKETLLERCTPIRNAWKARHGQPPSQSGPAPALLPSSQPPRPPRFISHSQKPLQSQIPLRYGPIAQSRLSKVNGPYIIAGMKR